MKRPLRLPKRGRGHQLGDSGFAKFQAAVPSDLFIVREETKDYGCDASLEAVVDEAVTGHRLFVQSKGSDRGKRLKDGTYTRSVDLSNLQYLLRSSPESIYVHWVEETQTLLYSQAAIYHQALVDAEVTGHKTVTIRFRHKLDLEAFQSLHRTFLATSGERAKLETLRLTSGSTEEIVVGLKDNLVLSRSEAERVLVLEGLHLGLNGNAKQVIDLADRFGFRSSPNPKIQLTIAGAEMSRVNLPMAKGALGRIVLDGGSFDNEIDVTLFTYIHTTVEHQMGELSASEYALALYPLPEILANSPFVGLGLRIEFQLVWMSLSGSLSKDIHHILAPTLERISRSAHIPPDVKLIIGAHAFLAEGTRIGVQYGSLIADAGAAIALDRPELLASSKASLNRLLGQFRLFSVSPRRSRSHQVPGIRSRPARAAWMAARRYSAGLIPRTFAVSTNV